jgi:hypothetical protein
MATKPVRVVQARPGVLRQDLGGDAVRVQPGGDRPQCAEQENQDSLNDSLDGRACRDRLRQRHVVIVIVEHGVLNSPA